MPALASQMLQRMQNAHGAKGFQALGVAVNDTTGALVPGYRKEFGLSFPIGYGTGDQARTFMGISVMERMNFPVLALIDQKGNIRFQHTGFQEGSDEVTLNAKIVELLAAGAARTPARPKARRVTPGAATAPGR
jgi:hypothetical protein